MVRGYQVEVQNCLVCWALIALGGTAKLQSKTVQKTPQVVSPCWRPVTSGLKNSSVFPQQEMVLRYYGVQTLFNTTCVCSSSNKVMSLFSIKFVVVRLSNRAIMHLIRLSSAVLQQWSYLFQRVITWMEKVLYRIRWTMAVGIHI